MSFTIGKQNCWFLCAVVAVAFCLRALLFVAFTQHDRHAWIYFDSDQYVGIARHIASGDGVCLEVGQPQTYRLPGYPAFVACGYWLFGGDEKPLLWVQIILSSLIPILVFMLSGLLFPNLIWVARVAAIVTAVHPGFILYAGMLATEPLFVLLFLLFLILFFSGLCKPPSPVLLMFFAGLALGLASLVRPVGHYVLVLSLLLIAICVPFWRAKLLNGLWISLGWLLAVMPWLVRNAFLTGALCFHTLPGLHFLQYTAANAVVLQEGCDYVAARGRLLGEWDAAIKDQEKITGRSLNDYERCLLGEQIARSYMLRYPIAAARYSCVQLVKTLVAQYASQLLMADTNAWPDYGKDVGWMARIKRFLSPEVTHRWLIGLVYYELLFFILWLIGLCAFLWCLCRDRNLWRVAFCFLPFALLLWGLTIAYGCARLRLPFEPILIIVAAYGWYSMVRVARGEA